MSGIFISYRRDDSEGHTGRLFEDLAKHFGRDAVFMDVAGIEKGRDFRRVIDEHISQCGVLLVIIGKNWLAAGEGGKRRLDDAADFVRIETGAALQRDIPVIPVLVQGAHMPREEDLPVDIKNLAFRNGAELTHARWDSDVKLLIEDLKAYVDVDVATTPSVSMPNIMPGQTEKMVASTAIGWRNTIIGSVLALMLGTGSYAAFLTKRSADEASRQAALVAGAGADAAKLAKEKEEADKVKAAQIISDQARVTAPPKVSPANAEAVRLAKLKADTERRARDNAEADRRAKQKADAVNDELTKATQMQLAQDNVEKSEKAITTIAAAEKAAEDKAAADRIAAEKIKAERTANEKSEAERIARETADADRLARQKKAEAERIAREKQAEADRLSAEKREREQQASQGTCLQGFVWRETRSSDYICVPPASRSQAASDNGMALARRVTYGSTTCIPGYVWREAFSGDVVCVLPSVRTLTAEENKLASNRVQKKIILLNNKTSIDALKSGSEAMRKPTYGTMKKTVP